MRRKLGNFLIVLGTLFLLLAAILLGREYYYEYQAGKEIDEILPQLEKEINNTENETIYAIKLAIMYFTFLSHVIKKYKKYKITVQNRETILYFIKFLFFSYNFLISSIIYSQNVNNILLMIILKLIISF